MKEGSFRLKLKGYNEIDETERLIVEASDNARNKIRNISFQGCSQNFIENIDWKKYFPNCTSVYVSSCSLDIDFTDVLPTNCKCMWIFDAVLSDRTKSSITRLNLNVLRANRLPFFDFGTNMKSLDLENIQYSDVNHLIRCISSGSLRVLSLDRFNASNDDFGRLFNTLKLGSCNIEHLSMCLDSLTAEIFGEALARNSSINKLYIDFNFCTGSRFIFEALEKYNRTVKKLTLYGCTVINLQLAKTSLKSFSCVDWMCDDLHDTCRILEEENGYLIEGHTDYSECANKVIKRNKNNHKRARKTTEMFLKVCPRVLNKDMLKMVAEHLWNTRADVKAWSEKT